MFHAVGFRFGIPLQNLWLLQAKVIKSLRTRPHRAQTLRLFALILMEKRNIHSTNKKAEASGKPSSGAPLG
ncbi:hypothetical protein HNQ99_003172 [Rhizorhapis suberifaciens]|uniref:Uncharacterized protein n=1 Tax=Rhizorhapis suberifaciens TaxID=13656 RepID=A0A840HZK1_9SPHN|nr:hypothetical protein [Rhizorhapis suberifaciens]